MHLPHFHCKVYGLLPLPEQGVSNMLCWDTKINSNDSIIGFNKEYNMNNINKLIAVISYLQGLRHHLLSSAMATSLKPPFQPT
jgi:hypothetical protein